MEQIIEKRKLFFSKIIKGDEPKNVLFFPIDQFYNSCNVIAGIIYYFLDKIDDHQNENDIPDETISPISWIIDILNFQEIKDTETFFVLYRFLAVFILMEYDEDEYLFKFFYNRLDPGQEFQTLISNLSSKSDTATLQRKTDLLTITLQYQDKNKMSHFHVSNIFNTKILPHLIPINSPLDAHACIWFSKSITPTDKDKANSIVFQPRPPENKFEALNLAKQEYIFIIYDSFTQNSQTSIKLSTIISSNQEINAYEEREQMKKTFRITTQTIEDPEVLKEKLNQIFNTNSMNNNNTVLGYLRIQSHAGSVLSQIANPSTSVIFKGHDANIFSGASLFFPDKTASICHNISSLSIPEWQKNVYKIADFFLHANEYSYLFTKFDDFYKCYNTALSIVSLITHLCEQPYYPDDPNNNDKNKSRKLLEISEYLTIQNRSLLREFTLKTSTNQNDQSKLLILNQIKAAFSQFSVFILLATVHLIRSLIDDESVKSKVLIFQSLIYKNTDASDKTENILKSKYLDLSTDSQSHAIYDRTRALEHYDTNLEYKFSVAQLINHLILKTRDFMTFDPLGLEEIYQFMKAAQISFRPLEKSEKT